MPLCACTYASNCSHTPASLRTRLQLAQMRIQPWSVLTLASAVWSSSNSVLILLGALAVGDVKRENHTAVRSILEGSDSQQDRDALPILADQFLLPRRHLLPRRKPLEDARVQGGIFRRCQRSEIDRTGDQVVARVPDRAQILIVGFADRPARVPESDAEEVRVGEQSKPCFASP